MWRLPALPVKGGETFAGSQDRCPTTGTLADGTSRISVNGTQLHHFNSISSFSEHAVVPASAAVRIRRDVDLEVAALCGCAVITGYGAVVHTAQVEPEANVAVWGCGGVGLNVVQGARLAGAAAIVAVDTRTEKLELARTLGATETVQAGHGVDTAAAVRDLTDGGSDYAFEAIGLEPTIQAAWEAVQPRGDRGRPRSDAEGQHADDRPLGLHQ